MNKKAIWEKIKETSNHNKNQKTLFEEIQSAFKIACEKVPETKISVDGQIIKGPLKFVVAIVDQKTNFGSKENLLEYLGLIQKVEINSHEDISLIIVGIDLT